MSNARSQRQKLKDWLIRYSKITTLQARNTLYIMHPAGRIKELIELEGLSITMELVPATPTSKRKIAEYVLLNGEQP